MFKNISVSLLDGKTHIFRELQLNISVFDFKKKILQEHKHIHPKGNHIENKMNLIFGGRVLEDYISLSDLDIESNKDFILSIYPIKKNKEIGIIGSYKLSPYSMEDESVFMDTFESNHNEDLNDNSKTINLINSKIDKIYFILEDIKELMVSLDNHNKKT